jgi:hypothetical protein
MIGFGFHATPEIEAEIRAKMMVFTDDIINSLEKTAGDVGRLATCAVFTPEQQALAAKALKALGEADDALFALKNGAA